VSEAFDSQDVPLLPLQTSDLDEALLAQLLFDIQHAAELLSVQVKARPGRYAEATKPTLGEAADLLRSGAVLAIQLRYRAQARVWCDTLLRTPSGFRIVRAPEPSRAG